MDIRRYVSGAVLIPLVIIPGFLGGPWVFALMVVVAAISAFEFDGLMRHGGYRVERLWGALLVLLPIVDAAYPEGNLLRYTLPVLVMASLLVPMRSGDLRGALVGWGLTLGGALYIGVLLAQVIAVRRLALGWELAFMTIASVWVNDSAAYLFGTRYGRRRLAPRISPKKSWEGAIGGSICGGLTGLALGYFFLPGVAVPHLLALNSLVAVAAVLGDLAESLIKRQVGAKDAGGVIPGHGGLLDRIDSLMYAFPVTALYATAVLGLS